MRIVLVIALLMGLVPDAVEAIEAGVHLAVAGHVAHLESGETDLPDAGAEHGCGPLDHHCGCCVRQLVVVAGSPIAEAVVEVSSVAILTASDTGVDPVALPFRPPIAA